MDKTLNATIDYAEFDQKFTEIIHGLPMDMLKQLKDFCERAIPNMLQGSIQFRLTVDTNILFREVRSLMLNGSSFLQRIADNPFLKLQAPALIREELHAKIRTKFPRDCATKNLDINACISQAELILQKLEIYDDVSVVARMEGQRRMSGRDDDDAAFVAISLEFNNHGIVTNDKDIIEQSGINTWQLSDAGRIVTTMGRGTFSMMAWGISVPMIMKLLAGVVSYVWQGIVKACQVLTNAILAMIKGGVSAISQLPIWAIGLAGLGFVLLLSNNRANTAINEFLQEVWLVMQKILNTIVGLVRNLISFFNEISEFLKPILANISILLVYLASDGLKLISVIREIESKRPVPTT